MTTKPLIPGTRVGFVGSVTSRVPPSSAKTGALFLGEHDWGPTYDELSTLDPTTLPLASYDEYTDLFGTSDTPARTAVLLAFAGRNIPGVGGLGGLIPLRLAPGAQRAALTIQNTAGTPVNAITFTADWKGTRGNSYAVAIDADPAAPTVNARARFYFQGGLLDTITYPKANITQLAANVAARDNIPLTVSSVVSGTALATTTQTVLAGGTNGTTITSSDYTTAVDLLEFIPIFGMASYNLTDGPTIAALQAWVQSQNDANRSVKFVTGGLDGDSISTALTRAATAMDPHQQTMGVGTFVSDLTGKTLNTAQLAPMLLGIESACGLSSSATGGLIGGLRPAGTTSIADADAATLRDGGVVSLVRAESDIASVKIADSVTTFTSPSDAQRPVVIFSDPRFVRIMDDFGDRLRRYGDENLVGLPNNQDTRDALESFGQGVIDEYLRNGLILTKANGAKDDPFIRVISTTDNTLPFQFGWTFAYTIKYVIGTGTVR